jgi:hypothetical protein
MCFPTKPPEVKPPAPPPPTPPPPEPPKPLPDPKPMDEKTRPKVQYGRKKSDDIRSRKGTDSLRIPLSTPTPGGSTGGLNV